MNVNKFLLGAASFVVAVIGAFAFKATNNFGSNILWGTIAGTNGTCYTSDCSKTFSNVSTVCKTVRAFYKTLTTLYTQKQTVSAHRTCLDINQAGSTHIL